MRRFWRVMVAEFDKSSFPIDAVAFEAVNEPGNFNTWGVANRAADLMVGFALLVAEAQPGRVLVLPAEMGIPRCTLGGPEESFVQSWESILRKTPGNGADSLNRFSLLSLPVVGTFHFYDPRRFTHQPRFYSGQASGGHVRWDVARDGGRVRMIFDAVRAAVPHLPFYIGEFGLDLDGIAPGSQAGADWPRSVREPAGARACLAARLGEELRGKGRRHRAREGHRRAQDRRRRAAAAYRRGHLLRPRGRAGRPRHW